MSRWARIRREWAQLQERAILALLSEPMLAHLRELAMDPNKIPETSGSRRLRLFLETRARAEGQAEGRAQGEAEGRARGKGEALVAILKARGLVPTSRELARIEACADPVVLDRWIAAAFDATRVRDVLGPARPVAARRRTPRRSASRG